jgi:antitoxin component HigA of HigAB toxin-antitoxin module
MLRKSNEDQDHQDGRGIRSRAETDRGADGVPSRAPQEEELLVLLVEKYEAEHYPIDLPDPVEAIKFRMEQEGLEPKDLIPYLGSQSKVSEVLNYKRPLSLSMIRSLQEGLGIPAEVLIQRPARDRSAGLHTDLSGEHLYLCYRKWP